MKLIDMTVDTLISQTRSPVANPGGGATLILISNLAMNLALMMDKKDWGEFEKDAKVSRETILNMSDMYKSYMQDDVENFNDLVKAYKSGTANQEDYVKASEPLVRMVETNIKILQEISFFLEHGKSTALVDGQVANDLLMQTILSAIPTIKLNMGATDVRIDYKAYINTSRDIYNRNKEIIERRMR